MRYGLRWACSLVFFALALPAVAQDKPKDSPDKPKDAKAQKDHNEAVNKLVSAGKMTGKLITWDSSDRSMTVDVDVPVPEIDQGVAKAIGDLQVQLAQAAYVANPRDRINR